MRAGGLLSSARRLAEAAGDGSVDVEVSILFSAISLEAFFNELQFFLAKMTSTDAGFPVLSTLGSALAELEESRASLRLKFQITSLLLTGDTVEKGSNPFQDLSLLISIRDALVHPRPAAWDMSDPSKSSNANLIRACSSRRLIPSSAEKDPKPWTQHVLIPIVACWSYNTALRTIAYITSHTPASKLADLLAFSYHSLEPLEFSENAV